MAVTWELKKLRMLIKARCSNEDYKQANLLINSIEWKIRAVKYHCKVADETLIPFFPNEGHDYRETLMLQLGSSVEAVKFSNAIDISEFNLVAAATNSHTIPDLLLQLAVFLFISPRPSIHSLLFPRSVKKLPAGRIKAILYEIALMPEYAYLNAFTNSIKHVALIMPEFHVSLTDGVSQGIRFRELRI